MIYLLEVFDKSKVSGGICCYCRNTDSSKNGDLIGSYDNESYCATGCMQLGYKRYDFYKNLDKACWGSCNAWCRAGEVIADGFGVLEVCQDHCYSKCECAATG